MARVHYWQYIVDDEGRPISGVDVRFYLAGSGTTAQANIYANSTVGHMTTTSAINLETNQDGYFEFWVGDEWELNGGYTSTQRFKIDWYKAGMARGEIDNIDLFPPLYQVDETITGQLVPTEAVRRNKLVSNRLAYNWEQHVEKMVPYSPSADAPHDIQPVKRCDPDTEYNKVVSNELMNKIFTLAVSASTVSLDASGADIDYSRIPLDHPWNASGALYYADVTHNLSNQYPILQVVDTTTRNLVIPEAFESLNSNSTRVVFSSSASQYMVTAIG